MNVLGMEKFVMNTIQTEDEKLSAHVWKIPWLGLLRMKNIRTA
jgi:hypothetical protein